MHVRAAESGLTVWAPAKLNLFLEVLAKREDGFHEIETLMCPIRLYDTLVFRSEPSGRLKLSCRWASGLGKPLTTIAGAPELETLAEGPDNTVVRALMLLREACGVTAGADLRLIKRIPTAAGLAGGSSDAAAALLAANQGWDLRLSPLELGRIAATVGSDVPFFLQGGAAICRGRGERIEPVGGLGELCFVVVKPPVGLGTPQVYRACRPASSPRSARDLVEALQRGRGALAGRLLHNQLQPAAESLSPWIERLKAEFARLDVLGHQMSGSGTSYFGLCRHAGQARRLAVRLRARGVGRVFAVRSAAESRILQSVQMQNAKCKMQIAK